MNETLEKTTNTHPSDFKKLGDFHPLVIARLVVEWARIDREFPMRQWGSDILGTHVTIGLDRYFVGRDDKQSVTYFQITLEKGSYGGAMSQTTWRFSLPDLQEKLCDVELVNINAAL